MMQERIMLWLKKHKAFNAITKFIISVTLLFMLFKFCYSFYSGLSETTKIVTSTLGGAVLGGCFTLIGSIYVNRSIQKAQNAIRRNNQIYKPLYEELMLIHNDILVKNPYPHWVSFEESIQTELKYPQYVEWGKIKMDSRIFEVPDKLQKAMSNLYMTIENYQDCLKNFIRSVDRIYMDERDKIDGINKSKIMDPGRLLYSYILTCNRPANHIILFDHEKTDENKANILWENLMIRCNEDSFALKCKAARISWENAEKKVLALLGFYIEYITLKYER